MTSSRALAHRSVAVLLALAALLAGLIVSSAVQAAAVDGEADGVAAAAGHLVISEVQTGGASASDEFVELYNPGPDARSLDGLELVYVTASGATITRKAAWGTGAGVGPGAHVLVANEAGVYAGIADVTYASGLAATGGSMALRLIGATTAVDAVGWGTAASSWLEGTPAPAPDTGSSLERLPGGALGSGQDSDVNLVDFVVIAVPDPQNASSPPTPDPALSPSPSPSASATPDGSNSSTPGPTESATPSATAEPTPEASATPDEPTTSPTTSPSSEPTPEPTPLPTPTPSPSSTATPSPTPAPTSSAKPSPSPSAAPLPPLVSIGEARAAEVNTRLRIRGVVILPSGQLDDATAAVADASGAILVRVGSDAGTLARGQLVELNGTRSTKSGMLTLRISVPATVLGGQAEPDAARRATGAIGETDEATLAIVRGVVADGPRKSTSGGLSFTVNDGSGALRVFVAAATRIQATDVPTGAWVEVRGVVGQETTGAQPRTGYRLWPRDMADLRVVAATTRAGGNSAGSTESGAEASSAPPDGSTTRPSGSLAALRRPILLTKDEVSTPSPSSSPSLLPSPVEGPVGAATRIGVPLAAGVGSLAGLAVLGWRRGTWRRLRDEVEKLAAEWRISPHPGGDRGGESYTPPP